MRKAMPARPQNSHIISQNPTIHHLNSRRSSHSHLLQTLENHTMMHLFLLFVLLLTSTARAALRGQPNDDNSRPDERRRAATDKASSTVGGQDDKTDGSPNLDCLGENTGVLDMWGLGAFAATLCDQYSDIRDDESLCFDPSLLGGIASQYRGCSSHAECPSGTRCLMIPLESSSGALYSQQTKCSTIEQVISTEYSVVIDWRVPKPLCDTVNIAP
jgi:hypothetical protein